MPKPYQVIRDYFPSQQFAAQMKTAETALGPMGVAALTGRKIMSANPTNFTQLFAAFVTFIRNAGNGLTWNGSGRGGSGYGLLDNDMKSGECAMFATAFHTLAFAPPPYGLGIPKTDLELASYGGRDGKGFVSNHPTAGIVGLKPNVKDQELYVWENHKVVKYQGRFWDVMYNTTYNAKDEMAVYQVMPNEVILQDEEVPVDKRGTYHPAEAVLRLAVTVGGSDAPAPGQRGVWFKENPLNVYAGPARAMPF